MKCQKCHGTGKEDIVTGLNCDRCWGRGEVEVTNEEWFCDLSTEEKAKVIANATYSTAETPLTILCGGKEAEQKKWEMWLKAVHK